MFVGYSKCAIAVYEKIQDKPNANIDYEKEMLTGLTAWQRYSVSIDDISYSLAADREGTISLSYLFENYMNKTISIVALGSIKAADSEAQTLEATTVAWFEEKVLAFSEEKVEYTEAYKEKLDALLKEYEDFSESDKKKVDATILKKLTDAEAAYERLEEQANSSKDEGENNSGANTGGVSNGSASNSTNSESSGASNTDTDKNDATSVVNVEASIIKTNTDKSDVKNATFGKLQLRATGKKKSVQLKWKKVSKAQSYIIYGSQCGKPLKKLATVKKTKWTNKKLKNGKFYKYVVVACKGNKTLAVSASVHAATLGGKYGNPSKVKVKSATITLKKKKTKRIKASVKVSKKNKVHIAKLRYESSNPKIETVSKKGVVKGLKKGSATIYVYAQNGVFKKVKVKVK